MKQEMKTNLLKGYLKFRNLNTLSVYDCFTRNSFKLSEVIFHHSTLNQFGDEFVTFTNPKTNKVQSSVVLYSL